MRKYLSVLAVAIFIALAVSMVTTGAEPPFSISERTVYSVAENEVYLEFTDLIDKDQYITNITFEFVDTEHTQKIGIKKFLLWQPYQQDVYGPVNVSLGKYKTHNTTCQTYYNDTLKQEIEECADDYLDDKGALMPCDYVLADKTCLQLSSGITEQITKYGYMATPTIKQKVVTDGLKIEQKVSGSVPLPKSGTAKIKVTMPHALAFGIDVTDAENKYNVTACSQYGCVRLDPGWWDANWDYSMNFSESAGSTFTNRFSNISIDTATLIAAGKMQANCSDARIVDDGNTEVPRFVINCNKQDTEFWFNFTNSSTANDWQFFYGYSGASIPTYRNLTDWAVGATTFDEFGNLFDITKESEWTADIDIHHTSRDTYQSGALPGNFSLAANRTSAGTDVAYDWAPAISYGKMQMKVNWVSGGSDPYWMWMRSDATDEMFVMHIIWATKKLEYYYAGGSLHTLSGPSGLNLNSWYDLILEWDSPANKFNITLRNESYSKTWNNDAMRDASSTAKAFTLEVSTLGGKYFIDDLILMETKEYVDPAFVLGSENSAPAADTCTYSAGDWVVDCTDACIIVAAVDMGGNNFYIDGAGTFEAQADIKNVNGVEIKGGCVVTCNGGCFWG